MATDSSWQEAITTVLDNHKVRDTVVDTLLWEDKVRTGTLFFAGIALFVVVEVFNLGIMMVIGIIAIAQLLLFRGAKYAQDKGLLFKGRDLKADFVLTPSPESVSTFVEIMGESFRLIEETIKELALSNDYGRLAQGFFTLAFFAALGRVLTVSMLVLIMWILSFSLLPIYQGNREFIDSSIAATEGFMGKFTGRAHED